MDNRILYYAILYFVLSVKVIVVALNFFDIDIISFGGGSDANYYHNYAIGLTDIALNNWPVFLRGLNEVGIYDRDVFSLILSFFGVFAIPFIYHLMVRRLNLSYFLIYYQLSVLWIVLYPSLFFFSLDIVRDTVMVFIFSLIVYVIHLMRNSTWSFRVFTIPLLIILVFALVDLRLYLAVSVFLAYFVHRFIKYLPNFYVVFFGYIFLCFLFSYLGLFNSLVDYRGGFDADVGGTTLGLDLSTSNPIKFMVNFFLSYLFQFFGFYFTNFSSIFVFLLESSFIIFSILILCRERAYIDDFVVFLIMFVVIYNTIWVIGNDNLGTAVRLRIYSYISIVFATLLTLGNKYKA